jgi:hypothetical protein
MTIGPRCEHCNVQVREQIYNQAKIALESARAARTALQ